jgi:hypothetical protein
VSWERAGWWTVPQEVTTGNILTQLRDGQR